MVQHEDAARRVAREYSGALGVGGGAADGERDAFPAPGSPFDFPRAHALLPSALDVAGLAAGSVHALGAAVDRFRASAGLTVPARRLDPARIAAAFTSERLFRLDGEPVSAFAELSGFFPAADGWIRCHANYPHHRERLCAALGLPRTATRAEFSATLTGLRAQDVENAAQENGAIAVRVRRHEEWAGSPAGLAAAAGPLLRVRRSDAAGKTGARPAPIGHRPLAGIRVLDLTRVIAGPVATRSLALLGADVLRVDPPQLPEIPWQHQDSGQGKRTVLLDARTHEGRRRLDRLLLDADVLVSGYRPGAIDSIGLDVPAHVIHGTVDAWGGTGPWHARRGFDSIVQAASGIALIEGRGIDGVSVPGALPAQALDHSSGYLLAAAVVDSLTERAASGCGARLSVSLARIASLLLSVGCSGTDDDGSTPAAAHAEQSGRTGDLTVAHGGVTTARPALVEYDDYPWPAHPLGSDDAEWMPRH